MSADRWDSIYTEGRHLLTNLLGIEVPVIRAVNGPATIHSELAVLGDVNLAAPKATFQDTHFQGAWCRVTASTWYGLCCWGRTTSFPAPGAAIDAEEALQIGLIGEIVASEELLDRTRDIARQFGAQQDVVRRYTRIILTRSLRTAELSLVMGYP